MTKFILLCVVGLTAVARAQAPATPLNGVNVTRTNNDTCPSGNATCIRANAAGDLLVKRNNLTAYAVSASPSPSPGQTIVYNTNGMWTPTAPGGGSSSEQTINAAATITIDPASGTTARIILGSTDITTINAASGTAGQILVVSIIQDSSGNRVIRGWSSSWLFRWGTYSPTGTANARDTLVFAWDNTNSVWVEIGRGMQSATLSGGIGQRLNWSLTDWNAASVTLAVNVAGAQANGFRFFFTRPGTVYGVRFYWAGTVARTVRGKLWPPSGGASSCSVVTAGVGTYSCYFATPHLITAANTWNSHTVSVYDTSGTDYTKNASADLTNGFVTWPATLNTQLGSSTDCGPGIICTSMSMWAADDSGIPNSTAISERYALEPIFSIP